MKQNLLVLLKVVDGGNSVDHVKTACLSAGAIWREQIHGGAPRNVRSVKISVPGDEFVLSSLVSYRNRGGISNIGFRKWLESHGLAETGVLLLFDVTVDETHNVTYALKGQLNHIQ